MPINKDIWYFSGDQLSEGDRSKLDCLEKVLALKTERVSKDRISHIGHCSLERLYYIKVYLDGGGLLRQWLGHARFDREYKNILLFNQLGIATPPLIAYGKDVVRFKLNRGVIVTEGLTDCLTLEQLALQNRLYERGVPWLRKVLSQIAEYTRLLHDDGFLHVDLKWRNILISDDEAGKVYFIDCPSGYHPPAWIFEKSLIKDLACLDRDAKLYFRKADQLFLYKSYARTTRLSVSDKKKIAATRAYYGNGRRKKRLFRFKRKSII